MAPADSFAAAVAESLTRRRTVFLCTVVRSTTPVQYPVGAKVVCPAGEAPRGFGLAEAQARALVERLPVANPPATPQVVEIRVGTSEVSALDVYCERLRPPLQLVIAGAGHIAHPLVAIARTQGWSVVVVDDRAEYAVPTLFPPEVAVICAPFAEVWDRVEVDRSTAVALVTRGHRHDEACLAALAEYEPFYVGMIGSRRRVHAVQERLERRGVAPDFFARVYAPVGLPIGTDTPAEIALAIVAEIVAVWRGREQWVRQEKETFYGT